jgi:hypothetical protein
MPIQYLTRRTTRVEDEPAENPGIPHGLAIRPDHPAFHRRAAAEDQVDPLAADARFQIERGVGVRVHPTAARLASQNDPGVNGLEHVIIVRTSDEEVARLGLGPELK